MKQVKILWVGIWNGREAAQHALQLHSQGQRVRLIGVDYFSSRTKEEAEKEQDYSNITSKVDCYSEFHRKIKGVRGIQLNLIEGSSTAVLPKLMYQHTFDQIFLRGGKFWETVDQDFHNAIRLLKVGGELQLDYYYAGDNRPPNKSFGFNGLVDYLAKKYEEEVSVTVSEDTHASRFGPDRICQASYVQIKKLKESTFLSKFVQPPLTDVDHASGPDRTVMQSVHVRQADDQIRLSQHAQFVNPFGGRPQQGLGSQGLVTSEVGGPVESPPVSDGGGTDPIVEQGPGDGLSGEGDSRRLCEQRSVVPAGVVDRDAGSPGEDAGPVCGTGDECSGTEEATADHEVSGGFPGERRASVSGRGEPLSPGEVSGAESAGDAQRVLHDSPGGVLEEVLPQPGSRIQPGSEVQDGSE